MAERGLNRRDIELGWGYFSTNRVDGLFRKYADLTGKEGIVFRQFCVQPVGQRGSTLTCPPTNESTL